MTLGGRMGMSRKQGRLIDTRLMMAIEIIAVATALDFCPGKQANRQSSAPPLCFFVRASSCPYSCLPTRSNPLAALTSQGACWPGTLLQTDWSRAPV